MQILKMIRHEIISHEFNSHYKVHHHIQYYKIGERDINLEDR